MKLLMLGSLLLSGGTAVAMQNETVQEEATQLYQRARYHIVHRFKAHLVDEVQETGFPYPPQSYLDTLTEDQEVAVLTAIDTINAEYDWQNMTEEEIIDALKVIKEDMDALYDELGIEGPTLRERIREAIQNRFADRLSKNGLPYPSDTYLEALTEEQQTALLAVIDEANTTYDWANMTQDEIRDAMISIREELETVAEEYDFELPTFRQRPHRPFCPGWEEVPTDETNDVTTES